MMDESLLNCLNLYFLSIFPLTLFMVFYLTEKQKGLPTLITVSPPIPSPTKNIFFYDFETNGLNPYFHDVIEIGIKKMNSESHYTSIVTPEIHPEICRQGGLYTYVSEKITQITGITNKLIGEEGIPEIEAFENMFTYILEHTDKEGPIYLVAHNGRNFDDIFLRKYMDRFPKFRLLFQRFRFVDSMLLSKLFLRNEYVSMKILTTKYRIENKQAHRAMGDVNALEELYTKLCSEYSIHKHYNDNYYLLHPESIIQECRIE